MKTFNLEVTEEELITIRLGLDEYRKWLEQAKEVAPAPEDVQYFEEKIKVTLGLKDSLTLQTVGQ